MKKINLFLVLFLISLGHGLRMKRIVYISSGPTLSNVCIPCADTDHNDSNELIFARGNPFDMWEIWEYRPLNKYLLVYADTGAYPYPPGITTGNFKPEDVGDIDRDSLIDLLGPNIDQPQSQDTFYYSVTTQEGPNLTTYPISVSWWFRHSNNYIGDGGAEDYFPPDLDNDGRKEILKGSSNPQYGLMIFENVSNNNNELVFNDNTRDGYNFTFGDFDMDGHQEFVTATLGSLGLIYIRENTGDNQYELVGVDTVHVPNGSDVFSGNDLDGDSKLEFFVAFAQYVGGNDWDFYLYMWEATGNNTYEKTHIATIRAGDWFGKKSQCGDIDGDGIEELVWSIGSQVIIYKATGNNQFERIWTWYNDHGGDFPQSIVNIYDMNKNGYNEIVVGGGNKTSIFEVEAVWLRRPNGRETFVGNTQEQIRWQKFYPPRCDSLSLFFSLDNGRTYDTIITGLPGADSSYLWTVPDTSSDSCKVRIIAYGPGWQYDESDGVFSITPSGISEIASPSLAMTSVEILPNPAKSKIRFKIWNAGKKTISLKIYNLAGELVKAFSPTTNNQKLITINWDGKDDRGKTIPTGVYIYRLKTSDGISETKEFIILK